MKGLINNSSGIIGVHLDGDLPRTIDLASAQSSCDLLFEYDADNGTHTLFIVFFGGIPLPGVIYNPSLHITDISYVHPKMQTGLYSFTFRSRYCYDDGTEVATSTVFGTPAATTTPNQAHHDDLDGIVGGIVSSVVGLLLVAGGIFWYFRRRRGSRRDSRAGAGSRGTQLPVVLSDSPI